MADARLERIDADVDEAKEVVLVLLQYSMLSSSRVRR